MLSFLLKVPLIDSDIQEDKILLRDILYNFIHEQHPYQAIDDMSAQNTNCSDFFYGENEFTIPPKLDVQLSAAGEEWWPQRVGAVRDRLMLSSVRRNSTQLNSTQ